MTLTNKDFDRILELVYAEAEKNEDYWGDTVWLPEDWNTDDRLTFGNWRAGLQKFFEERICEPTADAS